MMEEQVVREISALNQRGGRMLSAIDLLLAGTIDLRLAAYLMEAVRKGASVLCCAGPGGTGKTTLMGALLCFVPSTGVIKVVEKPEPPSWYVEQSDPTVPTWFLCHELGPGPWYSYLWGEGARTFLSMAEDNRFCATTVHADNLGELRRLLQGPEIALAPADFAKLDLILFIKAIRGQGLARWHRRVTLAYVSTGDLRSSHRSICRWDPTTDKFIWELDAEPLPSVTQATKPSSKQWLTPWTMRQQKANGAQSEPPWQPYYVFLQQLKEKRIVNLGDVRQEVVRFYRANPLEPNPRL